MFKFFEDSKKGKKDADRGGIFDNLKRETLRGILTIISFILGVFLALSAFGGAGVVGDTAFKILSSMFGIGYFILPILFFLLSASSLKTFGNSFGTLKIASAIVFFLSGITLVEIIFEDRGGLFGAIISVPLVGLFDIFVTLLILWGLVIASVLILFEAKLPSLVFFKRIFKKEDVETEYAEEEDFDEYEDEEEEEEEDEDAEEEEEKSSMSILSGKNDDNENDIIKMKPARSGTYSPPPLSILERDRGKPGVGDIKANANIIKRTLQNFGVDVQVDEISIGPSVTRYALKPAEGVRLSKILGLQNNLELALAAHPVRIEAPIPGRSLVGVEVPNTAKTMVGLYTILSTDIYQNSKKPLLISLGKDITGQSHFADLAKMPHVLIAGATGSGKSVAIHTIVTSLLFRNSPEHIRFIMIDPKRVELTLYNNIPHLLTPVITDAKKAILALKWAAKEMERRYNILEASSARDIGSYHSNVGNKKGENEADAMPYIIIVIDELADIMQMYPRELESVVVRLAQMSRAVGIHLILSTQRPSVNVITGLIKANVPSRLAFQVASQVDSRTILDSSGAEKLLGAGDMLYLSGEMSKPRRLQTAFISESEVKKVTRYLIKNYGDEIQSKIDLSSADSQNGDENSSAIFNAILDENESMEDDELYGEAKEIVMHAGKASTSYLQRKLRVGYARAARLMDMLEEKGVIGPADGARPREVLEKYNDENILEEDDEHS